MKIFVAHSSVLDFKNKLYTPILESELYKKYSFDLPLIEGIYKTTLENIMSSDIVIAEVSYPSTGMGIELGWANILKKPIIVFAKDGTVISKSLDKVLKEKFFYNSTDDMLHKLSLAIEQITLTL